MGNKSTKSKLRTSSCIPKLPEDVLLKVFTFLKGSKENSKSSDLISASLVCKQWNSIITRSPCLMDMLKLKVNFKHLIDDQNGDVTEEFMLTRSYREAILMENYYYDTNDNPVMIKLRFPGVIFAEINMLQELTTIELYRILISPDILQFLTNCNMLQALIVNACGSPVIDRDTMQFCHFKDLKSLSFLQHSSTFILNLITCDQLDYFCVKSVFEFDSSAAPRNIINFLSRLSRCDQIDINVLNWRFDIQYMPKFMCKMNKMNLIRPFDQNSLHTLNDDVILKFESLFGNSLKNYSDKVNNDGSLRHELDDLWTEIYENCKGIGNFRLQTHKLNGEHVKIC